MAQAELTWVPGSVPRWVSRPKSVTHPGTNRARRRVTMLIKSNGLPLCHIGTTEIHLYLYCNKSMMTTMIMMLRRMKHNRYNKQYRWHKPVVEQVTVWHLVQHRMTTTSEAAADEKIPGILLQINKNNKSVKSHLYHNTAVSMAMIDLQIIPTT